MKFSIITDQICVLSKVNIATFYKQMIAEGHELVLDYTQADIVIFQPCQLVNVNQELIEKIREKKVKVLFCYKKEDFEKIENLELVSHEWLGDKKNHPVFWKKDKCFVYIGSGCVRTCAYCPIKRSSVVSRSINTILNDIEGAKKVMLCADDCSSYKYGLIELLKKMPEKEIHLSYVYPSYLIKHADYFIAHKERISIDVVPIQSASSRVLKLMNRHDYDVDRALEVMNHLKMSKVHFMFGYPTETWEDFLKTVNFEEKLKKVEEYVLWFTYNPYKGTQAEITYGDKKNPLIDSMREHLIQKKSKHNRAVLNFFDKNYGSIVVGFNEKEEMLFYRASDLKRVEGVWDEDDNYNPPTELLGKS